VKPTAPGWQPQNERQDLTESLAPDDPMALFEEWFNTAKNAGLIEPTAMTLATADAAGRPSARTVLLKHYSAQGFVFFTNYLSRKGTELAANPQASLLFWWDRLERQIRIEGRVEKIDDASSDAYFASRDAGSRLGAWASSQSQAIDNREALDLQMQKVVERFGDEVPRPPHWGGYKLVPQVIEFWQGRRNRLHDRLCYTHGARGWVRQRLQP